MPTIGLTGGFGMGKSTVLRLFGKLGAETIDSDEIVHNILQRPETIRKITSLLGESVLKKRGKAISVEATKLDKKRVADIIFNEPEKRISIEKIIHPKVMRDIKALMNEKIKNNPSLTVVVEVPLLFEAGYEKYFDKVIVVFCRRDVAIKRLLKKGFAKEDAIKRMRAQMPTTRKKASADFVIDNNDGIKKTGTQVKRFSNEN
ncbi:MAG: dephospho-CoA kinase [Nitrospirae bacterium]|nr:dephospho-CoA kinase [Nitrospirota bacterium]